MCLYLCLTRRSRVLHSRLVRASMRHAFAACTVRTQYYLSTLIRIF